MCEYMDGILDDEGIFNILIDKIMISTVFINKIKGKINYE